MSIVRPPKTMKNEVLRIISVLHTIEKLYGLSCYTLSIKMGKCEGHVSPFNIGLFIGSVVLYTSLLLFNIRYRLNLFNVSNLGLEESLVNFGMHYITISSLSFCIVAILWTTSTRKKIVELISKLLAVEDEVRKVIIF